MLLSACGQNQNSSIQTYRVKDATGLYATFGDINAEQIAVLPTGTILTPADDETKLFCDKFVNADMPYVLCKVKVSDTGQTGWVLKLFIEKN